ncbi:Embryo-specific protein 3, (ATS3) [Musa troglodytarum]|uniref:Embryo-specific protein 3, (ATS3) n=1 Tax=Musa troglodytarum TaxID=320322 RepID=A0A9E7JF28_9LILI|nr:Embryo-specific protein 3, (ATS3) [Musa troglodytarum]
MYLNLTPQWVASHRKMGGCLIVQCVRLLLLLLLAIVPFVASAEEDECVYTVYVRTGSVFKAGTDATIGLTLGDAAGREVAVADLVAWGGLMGPDHDYYERGALDAFSGRGPCGLATPLCRLNLTSDGAGAHHGWYCEYVEVTATGPHALCSQTLFYVRQWLATDAPPYRLYATVDGCDQPEAAPISDHRRLVVGPQTNSSSSSSSSS